MSLSEDWPAISNDSVLDTILWCLISHLWSSMLGNILENGIVIICPSEKYLKCSVSGQRG